MLPPTVTPISLKRARSSTSANIFICAEHCRKLQRLSLALTSIRVGRSCGWPMNDDSAPPITVNVGRFFAAAAGPENLGLFYTGQDPVEGLALRLWACGTDPDRKLILYRNGRKYGQTTIAEAARVCRDC